MSWKSRVQNFLARLCSKRSTRSQKLSNGSKQESSTTNPKSWILEGRSPANPPPEWNKREINHLKRQPEWGAMIDMFSTNMYSTQDAMLQSGRTPEELAALAAQGRIQSGYLSMALERPPTREKEEE